jgi:hypothetical protein
VIIRDGTTNNWNANSLLSWILAFALNQIEGSQDAVMPTIKQIITIII